MCGDVYTSFQKVDTSPNGFTLLIYTVYRHKYMLINRSVCFCMIYSVQGRYIPTLYAVYIGVGCVYRVCIVYG